MGNACKFDYNIGKMTCDTTFGCEGGKHYSVDNHHSHNKVSYDCGECHDVQRESCCNTCQEVKQNAAANGLTIHNERIHEVECDGCDRARLNSHDEIQCSHNPRDGHFQCRLQTSCQTGRTNFDKQNLSYHCTVTPCDSCPDSHARAQCCVQCLNHFCNQPNSFHERRICSG